MINEVLDRNTIDKSLETLALINENLRWEIICEIDKREKEEYNEKLKIFKDLHDKNIKVTEDLHIKKGKALEDLVTYLLEISGKLFEVERNIRTTTNEIDQIIMLKPMGKMLMSYGLLDKRFGTFLGECKNYNKSVDVTYVGKFCSLLMTNQIKLGILFSYHGISGKNWSNGSGLVKKIYLNKEKLEERICIIDFSIKDFERISKGNNFIQIVIDKLNALQFDTDISRFINKHPAE